jgi:hypothetical protein
MIVCAEEPRPWRTAARWVVGRLLVIVIEMKICSYYLEYAMLQVICDWIRFKSEVEEADKFQETKY